VGNVAASYLMSGELPPRVGNSHPQIAPYDLIRTADGYVTVAGGNDALWRRLCAALGLEELAADARFATNAGRVRHRKELLADIEAHTEKLVTDEVLVLLEQARVPAGPIRDLRQGCESPRARHRGLARRMTHPTTGEFQVVDTALRLVETPAVLRLPPPTLGEHTDEVLSELGFSAEQIATWRVDGTI